MSNLEIYANWAQIASLPVSVIAIIIAAIAWLVPKTTNVQLGKVVRVVRWLSLWILIAFFSFSLGSQASALSRQRGVLQDSYEVTIQANVYPLMDTNIQLNPGDEIEIRVLGASTTYLNCGLGGTSPMGMTDHEYQPGAVYPGAKFMLFHWTHRGRPVSCHRCLLQITSGGWW